MTIQTCIPGFGIDDEQRKLLAICEEQIEAVERLRRQALRIRNFGIVADCDDDLRDLGKTARALRSSLAMPQASYGCAPSTKSGLEACNANVGNLEPAQAQDCEASNLVGTGASYSKQNFPSHEGQGGNQQTNNV